ncbi:MAG: PaaI family thioesterase [Sphingomonadales bacterium]|nr:PaaI family thioesterase [Sphingomonadales bacterium]
MSAYFRWEPSPDHPGWTAYDLAEPEHYNRGVLGTLLVRGEAPDTCRVRLAPRVLHTNSAGRTHGGVTLGLVDVSLFAAMYQLRGIPVSGSVTVDLQCQFIGGGDGSRPLDCVVEMLRETRRLCFLRGLVVQDDDLVASFTATTRKPSSPK